MDLTMMQEVQIFAVDPGSEWCGWAYAKGDKLLSLGRVNVHRDADDRLAPTAIKEEKPWRNIFALHTWMTNRLYDLGVDVVGIELPTGNHQNQHTDRVISGAFVAVYLAAREQGLKIEIVRPATVKQTGYHKNARRAATLLARKQVAPLVSEDEADAIGVWQATWRRVCEDYMRAHG